MSGELRMRVFAGPNGSGKSTIIKSVREYTADEKHLDFGIYINADDIARDLRDGSFDFSTYELKPNNKEFRETAILSGLITKEFPESVFDASYIFNGSKLILKNREADERLAQIIADVLRKMLLFKKRKFSFETVFSHPSKLDIMRQAAEAGYKVYLYFVSTDSPDINKNRVATRVQKNGHNVPNDKIESRYYRSLEQLYDAAQISYQVYFFDNTGIQPKLFAHFKQVDGRKNWDEVDRADIPRWFAAYYLQKQGK